MTANDVVKLIRERYPANGWAMLEQVANGTGAKARRWADVVVMGLWPSRGMEIEGFEVKVSRSDWTSELKEPEKADEVARYCDRWWLAVSDAAIVKDGELPPTWGLLAPKRGKLEIVVPAPKLDPLQHLDRSFVAAVLRRAQAAMSVDRVIAEEVDKRVSEQIERVRKEAEEHAQSLLKIIREFEEGSGLRIVNGWNQRRVGEVARRWLNGEASHVRGEMMRLRDTAEAMAKNITRDLAALERE